MVSEARSWRGWTGALKPTKRPLKNFKYPKTFFHSAALAIFWCESMRRSGAREKEKSSICCGPLFSVAVQSAQTSRTSTSVFCFFFWFSFSVRLRMLPKGTKTAPLQTISVRLTAVSHLLCSVAKL